MKKKKSNYFITVILVLMLLAGLSLLLYPSVSDYWNSFHQSQAISQYSEKVKNLDKEMRKKMWEDAQSYNQRMKGQNKDYTLSEEEKAEYESMLNVDSNGIMGYIEIPKINCSLPIYHGTNASVLQTAIGHLEWTSLPVGGESTHCVLSGHRGLPSAKLFTNLDKLNEGDIFMLRVMDEVLTYEVDQILIVEPQQVEALRIVEGQDYCTLVTCTPYGINSHRLLVRGHRIENVKEANKARVAADAVQIEPLIVAPAIATPMLLLLLVILLLPRQRKKNHGGDDDEDF